MPCNKVSVNRCIDFFGMLLVCKALILLSNNVYFFVNADSDLRYILFFFSLSELLLETEKQYVLVCVNGVPGSKLLLMLEFNTVFLLISCL